VQCLTNTFVGIIYMPLFYEDARRSLRAGAAILLSARAAWAAGKLEQVFCVPRLALPAARLHAPPPTTSERAEPSSFCRKYHSDFETLALARASCAPRVPSTTRKTQQRPMCCRRSAFRWPHPHSYPGLVGSHLSPRHLNGVCLSVSQMSADAASACGRCDSAGPRPLGCSDAVSGLLNFVTDKQFLKGFKMNALRQCRHIATWACHLPACGGHHFAGGRGIMNRRRIRL